MLLQEGCQENTSKAPETPSRVRILGILLLQPSSTSSSLSLLKHRLKTIWSQSRAPAAQLWSRSCPQEPPAGFSSPPTFLLTPACPKSCTPRTMKCQLAPAGQQPLQTQRFHGKDEQVLPIREVWAGGEGPEKEPEKGFWTVTPLDHDPLGQVTL